MFPIILLSDLSHSLTATTGNLIDLIQFRFFVFLLRLRCWLLEFPGMLGSLNDGYWVVLKFWFWWLLLCGVLALTLFLLFLNFVMWCGLLKLCLFGFEICWGIGIENGFGPVAVHVNCVTFYCYNFDVRKVEIYWRIGYACPVVHTEFISFLCGGVGFSIYNAGVVAEYPYFCMFQHMKTSA